MDIKDIEFKAASNKSKKPKDTFIKGAFTIDEYSIEFGNEIVDYLDELLPDEHVHREKKGVFKVVETWDKFFYCKFSTAGLKLKIEIVDDEDDDHMIFGSLNIEKTKNGLTKSGSIFFNVDGNEEQIDLLKMMGLISQPSPKVFRVYTSIDHKLDGRTIYIEFSKTNYKDEKDEVE